MVFLAALPPNPDGAGHERARPAAALLALLWNIWTRQDAFFAPPAPGLTSFAADTVLPPAFLLASGFASIAGRAVRLDMLERLEDELEKALASGTNAEALLARIISLLGSNRDEAAAVLGALGWRQVEVKGETPRRHPERTGLAQAARAPPRHGRPRPTASAFALCRPCRHQGGEMTDKAVRLDKWLFHARLCRTRTAAQEAAASGRLRLNGQRVSKPGHAVRPR